MRSFLFDTNALVYWVNPSAESNPEIKELINKALESRAVIYALTSSLSDVYYILHSQYTTEEVARNSVQFIAETFDLVDLTGIFVFEAIDSNEPDYEDGLIRAVAEAIEVDAIISYDKKAFRNSFIPRMTAEQALELV